MISQRPVRRRHRRTVVGDAVRAWFNEFLLNATGLPAGKATYKFRSSCTRESVSSFSTRTDLTWTFTSQATTGATKLPLVGVRYQPRVDQHNVADRTPIAFLPISLVTGPGTELPSIRKVELQVSGDDGKTWQRAAVRPADHGSYRAIFATPAGAGPSH